MGRYYTEIQPGKIVACAYCGKVFEGGNCRNLAKRCYQSHLAPPEPPRNFTAYEKYTDMPFPTDDKTEHPDEHGHYYRGHKDHWRYLKTQVNKSLSNAERREFLKSVSAKPAINANPRHTPLQRLSYAYHFGGWEAVRQAAYALAYSEAVKRKIEELNIPEMLTREIQLYRALQQALEDLRDIDAAWDNDTINRLLDQLSMNDFLDYLEQGGKADDYPD